MPNQLLLSLQFLRCKGKEYLHASLRQIRVYLDTLQRPLQPSYPCRKEFLRSSAFHSSCLELYGLLKDLESVSVLSQLLLLYISQSLKCSLKESQRTEAGTLEPLYLFLLF